VVSEKTPAQSKTLDAPEVFALGGADGVLRVVGHRAKGHMDRPGRA